MYGINTSLGFINCSPVEPLVFVFRYKADVIPIRPPEITFWKVRISRRSTGIFDLNGFFLS